MAIDTPARIAVIGAGPIGLEAALYARYLGYEVTTLERGRVCEHVRKWQHVRMFSTWSQLTSPLGRVAIETQFGPREWPPGDQAPTGREWLDQYLLPLAQTDLIADSIRTDTTVVSVSRTEWLKTDTHVDRRDWTFQLMLRDGSEEMVVDADAVFDASGVLGQPRDLGAGGVPARGEQQTGQRIVRWLPDILGRDRERFAEKRVLVIGGGSSAATAVMDLVKLAGEFPGTHVTWVRRRPRSQGGTFAFVAESDRPRGMLRFMEALQQMESSDVDALEVWGNSWIESVDHQGDQWEVVVGGEEQRTWNGDQIVALVGYRPDIELFRELQVDLSPVWECSERLAGWLELPPPQRRVGAEGVGRLDTGEPDFYLLGAKSYGRNSGYFYREGLLQIRDLFTRLGERDDLDVYASFDSTWNQ